MFPQMRSFVPFYTLGGYLFLYKVYPLRTPFTMIVYFDQSRVDSFLNAKPITAFEPANCNTRRLGIETIYIFSVGIGGI